MNRHPKRRLRRNRSIRLFVLFLTIPPLSITRWYGFTRITGEIWRIPPYKTRDAKEHCGLDFRVEEFRPPSLRMFLLVLFRVLRMPQDSEFCRLLFR